MFNGWRVLLKAWMAPRVSKWQSSLLAHIARELAVEKDCKEDGGVGRAQLHSRSTHTPRLQQGKDRQARMHGRGGVKRRKT